MPSKYKFKGKKMEINYYSLDEAIKIKPTNETALISLIDPELEGEFEFDTWKYRLQLCFDDVDDANDGIAFNSKMAKSVIEFNNALPQQVNHIIIHCVAGISRSSAVTKFLTKYIYPDCFNTQFDVEYQQFNQLVYNRLCFTWDKIVKAKKV